MKILLITLCLLISGCATTYSLVKIERTGPVEIEVWKNNKTKKCERRIYLDVLYYKTEVPCP